MPAAVSLPGGILKSSDYIISIQYPTQTNGSPTQQAHDYLQQLLSKLKSIGFYSQSRAGENDSLLVFVKANDAVLFKAIKSLMLKDYLYGLSFEITSDSQIPKTLTYTEKLGVVYQLLTTPESDGGASITPGVGSWAFVNKIIPIYDSDENKALLKEWLLKPLIDEQDILKIREIAGEKVALYFGFLRFYFLWLFIPTALGLLSNFFFKRFSIVFTILNSLWTIIFINAWKKKESIYAMQWNTKGSSKIEVKRADFIGEIPTTDPSTGLATTVSPKYKRSLKKSAFIPIAIASGVAYFCFQILCFFIEIFLTEIYQGPYKDILALVPTVMIVIGSLIITGVYQKIIKKAVKWENHEIQSSFDSSVTEKLFVHNFLGSYVPLFITIFAYLPFGHIVNEYLPFIRDYSLRYNIPVVQEKYQINSGRLVNQFEYFSKTSLIIGFLLENVVPVATRLLKEHLTKGKTDYAALNDAPEETEFLKEIRKQVSLPAFDVNAEYRELIINFGYLAIFGPIWSLAPLFSLISNYVEIKGDLEKLLAESSRPVPVKVENIDPWNTNLTLLTWIGSLVGPVITTFFRQQDGYLKSSGYNYLQSSVNTSGLKAVSTALISENISIILNVFVEKMFNAFTTDSEKEHIDKTLSLRRYYFESYLKQTLVEKKNIVLDHSSTTWSKFNDHHALKYASTIPVDLKEAKGDTISVEKSKEQKNIKNETISTESLTPIGSVKGTTSGSQRFDNDSTLQHRIEKNANTTSKTTPATQVLITPSAPTTTNSSVSTSQIQLSTNNSREYGSGSINDIPVTVNNSITSTGSAPSGENSNLTLSDATKPSYKDSSKSKSESKKKKGLFGFGRKDSKSVGKAGKKDAEKNADQLKNSYKDVKNDDLSSAKQLSKDVEANPEDYRNNTQQAINDARTEKNSHTALSDDPTSIQIPSESAQTTASVDAADSTVTTVTNTTTSAAGSSKTEAGPSVSTNATNVTTAAAAPSSSSSSSPRLISANVQPDTTKTSINNVERKSVQNVDFKKPSLTPDMLVLKSSKFVSHGNSTKSDSSKAVVKDDSTKSSIQVPAASVVDGTQQSETDPVKNVSAVLPTAAPAENLNGSIAAVTTNPNPNPTTVDPLKASEIELCAKSSSGGLNGATLPPNFGSKKSASFSSDKIIDSTSASAGTSNYAQNKVTNNLSLVDIGIPVSGSSKAKEGESKNHPGQEIGHTGKSGIYALAVQPESALDNANASSILSSEAQSNLKALDLAAVSIKSNPNQSPSRVPAVEDSHATKLPVDDSELKPVTGLGVSFGGLVGESSNQAKESEPGYLDQAKEYAGKTGAALNDYVQKAADTVNGYAQESENQYVAKGNEYIQQAAENPSVIPKNQSTSEFRTAEVGEPITPVKKVEKNGNKHFKEVSAYNQFANKAALGEASPTQNSPSLQSDGASANSITLKKVKRGFFSTIKHKVKSNNSTPKKKVIKTDS